METLFIISVSSRRPCVIWRCLPSTSVPLLSFCTGSFSLLQCWLLSLVWCDFSWASTCGQLSLSAWLYSNVNSSPPTLSTDYSGSSSQWPLWWWMIALPTSVVSRWVRSSSRLPSWLCHPIRPGRAFWAPPYWLSSFHSFFPPCCASGSGSSVPQRVCTCGPSLLPSPASLILSLWGRSSTCHYWAPPCCILFSCTVWSTGSLHLSQLPLVVSLPVPSSELTARRTSIRSCQVTEAWWIAWIVSCWWSPLHPSTIPLWLLPRLPLFRRCCTTHHWWLLSTNSRCCKR